MKVTRVVCDNVIGENADTDVDTGAHEALDTTAGDPLVWIGGSNYDSGNPCVDDRIGARWCLPMVIARFERHEQRGSLRVLNVVQHERFGMWSTADLVGASGKDYPIWRTEHSPDTWIRMRVGSLSRLECPTHQLLHARAGD
jgi:hypothetical protein